MAEDGKLTIGTRTAAEAAVLRQALGRPCATGETHAIADLLRRIDDADRGAAPGADPPDVSGRS